MLSILQVLGSIAERRETGAPKWPGQARAAHIANPSVPRSTGIPVARIETSICSSFVKNKRIPSRRQSVGTKVALKTNNRAFGGNMS